MATPAQWALIRHFVPSEMACSHCGVERMSYGLLCLLDAARERSGVPFQITSGSRCEKHNAEVGGSPTSSHLFTDEKDSCAVDVSDHRDPILRGLIVIAAIEVGLTQIEVSKDGHVHLMSDPAKPRGYLGIE